MSTTQDDAHTVLDVKYNFPFDLNNLFNLTYSFDTLKTAIEYLAKQQSDQQVIIDGLANGGTNISSGNGGNDLLQRVQNLEQQCQKHENQLGNHESNISKMNDLLGDHGNMLKQHEHKLDQYNNVLNDHAADLKNLDAIKDNHEKRITDLENAQKMMGKLSSSDGSGDSTNKLLDAIKDISDNIRDECDKKYALKRDQNDSILSNRDHQGDLEKRVENLERDNKENKEQINAAYTRIDSNSKGVHKNADDIKKLQRDMKDLAEKMDILAGTESDIAIPELNIPKGKDGGELTSQQFSEAIQPLIKLIKQMELKLKDKADQKALHDLNDELREYIESRLKSVPMSTQGDSSSLLKTNSSQGSTGVTVSKDDRDNWDAAANNVKSMQDQINILKKEFANLDINTLKSQISTTAKLVNSCVQKTAFDALQEELRKAKEDIKDSKYDISQLQDKFDRLMDNVLFKGQAPTTDEFKTLRTKVDSCENQINMLKKLISNINQTLKNMPKDGSARPDTNHKNEIDGDLEEEVRKLKQSLDDYKDVNDKRMSTMQKDLDDKATKQELADLEQRLLDKLQELMNSLAGLFADKEGTRKRLNALEKNIKNLYDLFVAQFNGGNNNQEDDAMFTKKPYGPVSCASCEKNIVNLEGKQADYMAWKRLPFREPSERIARYGQGFSKILSMMKPEQQAQAMNQTVNFEQKQRSSMAMDVDPMTMTNNDGLNATSYEEPTEATNKDTNRIYSKYYAKNSHSGKKINNRSGSVNASPMKSQGPMDEGQLPEVKGALRSNNNTYQ